MQHRTALKNRIHATPTLIAFGHPCPVSDLFGAAGRELLDRLEIPEPWAGTLEASLALIEELEVEIDLCEKDLRRLGADHPYVPLLVTAPGIAWVLGYTSPRRSGTSPGSPRRRSSACGLTKPSLEPIHPGWTRPPQQTEQRSRGSDHGWSYSGS